MGFGGIWSYLVTFVEYRNARLKPSKLGRVLDLRYNSDTLPGDSALTTRNTASTMIDRILSISGTIFEGNEADHA
jgi:hypothetical protein